MKRERRLFSIPQQEGQRSAEEGFIWAFFLPERYHCSSGSQCSPCLLS
jgi:hypothetical protein